MYKIKEVSIGYFLRIILILIFAGISYMVLKCLSGVLLPFLIAWLLAYLIYPIVKFVQYRMKFRFRIVSIVAVLLFIVAIATGFIMLALPSLTTEIIQFKDVAIGFINNQINVPSIPDFANNLIREFAEEHGVANILQNSGVQDIFKSFAERTWFLAMGTINVVMKIFASCITIMYLFFILLDYERLSEEWQTLIPVRWRHKANTLMNDLTEGMNQYFRGQALIPYYRLPYGNSIRTLHRCAQPCSLSATYFTRPDDTARTDWCSQQWRELLGDNGFGTGRGAHRSGYTGFYTRASHYG